MILSTAIEVCEGMAYMHSHRVVHRDLTSGNVLLMHEPMAQRVKAKVSLTLRSQESVANLHASCQMYMVLMAHF